MDCILVVTLPRYDRSNLSDFIESENNDKKDRSDNMNLMECSVRLSRCDVDKMKRSVSKSRNMVRKKSNRRENKTKSSRLDAVKVTVKCEPLDEDQTSNEMVETSSLDESSITPDLVVDTTLLQQRRKVG
ncbi:hypothetical protein EVAR_30435_1 [Eumeta japonica]|uniref:Uncharacterized protein n=1 Tax=Eumeta variegata TaxID=151549 RepID=A0A4C1W815_EUMVA|nr:hypothetical protein EVAR_30435_1 [Eumeta japonica]